jgi:hypothetical protein
MGRVTALLLGATTGSPTHEHVGIGSMRYARSRVVVIHQLPREPHGQCWQRRAASDRHPFYPRRAHYIVFLIVAILGRRFARVNVLVHIAL